MKKDKILNDADSTALICTLKKRFEAHMPRHAQLIWSDVATRLESRPDKLWCLNEMERTGGEPDLLSLNDASAPYIFYDCAKESPAGRRSICYDEQARTLRKKYPPKTSAIEMANFMGINLLTEEQYKFLQKFGPVDTKTSSWIKTPEPIRKLGGALFADYRYDTIFVYHNGADSYYGARAFRGILEV